MDVKKDIVFRLSTIYLIAAITAIVIIFRIFQLQFFKNKEYGPDAVKAQFKTVKTYPERGDICAWDGKVLATSQPFYELRLDLGMKTIPIDTFNKYIPILADSLSKVITEKTREEIYNELIIAKSENNRFLLLKKDVDYAEYQRFRSFPILRLGQFKGGFIALKRSKRILPYGDLGSRTIGSLTNDKYIGLEGYFDAELQGAEQYQQLRKIGPNWIPVESIQSLQALSGKDIITTLDVNIQDFAHHALLDQLQTLNADTGVVILMEVKTGEIKAMVNLMRNSQGEYIEGYNHAVGTLIEPGSTFKLASLISALEDGFYNLNDSIQTGNGYLQIGTFKISESAGHGYGKLSVEEVFEKSSNVGTAKLIRNAYNQIPEKFVNRITSMELDKKVGIEINGEPVPFIKYPKKRGWSGVTLPQMSIGYEIMLTPLQILNFYNAVANNGVMVKPRIVRAIREHGKIIKEFEPQIINPSICSESTIKKAKIMLEGVVSNGTAKNINGSPYKIAGKTGTAQVAIGSSGYHDDNKQVKAHYGSFAGYFPADNPQYSCIVVIQTKDDHYFYGNLVAAPVFRKLADKVYASSPTMRKEVNLSENSALTIKDVPISKDGNIKDLDLVYSKLRIPVKGRDKIRSAWIVTTEFNQVIEYQNRLVRRDKVPMVVGMGLKDAVYLMESVGLRVIVKGRGVIRSQSIDAGKDVRKNQIVILTLG